MTRDRRMAALRRHLPGATRKRFAQVASFDDVPEVEITAVDLPRTPAAPPSSRSVQPEVHPVFVRTYPEPVHPLRVVAVPDGHLVTGGGVVLTGDEVLVGETMWDLEHFRRDFDPPRRLGAPTHLRGTHASIISLWSGNYIIVPETLTRFQRETLALVGVPEERMTPVAKLRRNLAGDSRITVVQAAVVASPGPVREIAMPSARRLRSRCTGTDANPE